MSISETIAAVSDRLTPTERRVAEAVLREPTLLAFGTVSDLADRVGTSRPSIMRFATKLGFEGYADLQRHVRQNMSRELSRPSQRIRHLDDPGVSPQAALTRAIACVFEALQGERLTALAAPIASAQNVWILTGETSRAGAHALLSGLTMVRPNVHLIEEHASGRDLGNAGPGDTAVVLDFARYRRHSVGAAKMLVEAGLQVVAITDGPLSPLASIAQVWCSLEIPAIGPFDSSVPAVTAAELIVSRVASLLKEEAQSRIDRTEELWAATDTFMD